MIPITSHGRCRREEEVGCRLHIGHSFLTHFYLLKGEEQPVCIPCNEVLSGEHIFTKCEDLQEYRDWLGFFKTLVLSCCSVSILRTLLSFSNLICMAKCDGTIVPSELVNFHTRLIIKACDFLVISFNELRSRYIFNTNLLFHKASLL